MSCYTSTSRSFPCKVGTTVACSLMNSLTLSTSNILSTSSTSSISKKWNMQYSICYATLTSSRSLLSALVTLPLSLILTILSRKPYAIHFWKRKSERTNMSARPSWSDWSSLVLFMTSLRNARWVRGKASTLATMFCRTEAQKLRHRSVQSSIWLGILSTCLSNVRILLRSVMLCPGFKLSLYLMKGSTDHS